MSEGLGSPASDSRSCGEGLQAARLTAAAENALWICNDVTNLAGHPAGAAIEPAVDHDPGTDPRADRNICEAARPARGGLVEQPCCGQVDVVLDPTGDSQCRLEETANGHVIPVKIGRQLDDAGLWIDPTRDAHPDCAELRDVDSGGLESGPDRVYDRLDADGPRRHRAHCPADLPPPSVSHDGRNLRAPHVDAGQPYPDPALVSGLVQHRRGGHRRLPQLAEAGDHAHPGTSDFQDMVGEHAMDAGQEGASVRSLGSHRVGMSPSSRVSSTAHAPSTTARAGSTRPISTTDRRV